MAQLLFGVVTSIWCSLLLLLPSTLLGDELGLSVDETSSECNCSVVKDAKKADALPTSTAAPDEVPWYLASLSYLSILILVTMSGLFSGLTLGLLGLDMNGLEIAAGGDNMELARCAKKLMPVRRDGNLLLCTLLLGNVAVNCLLAILMGQFGDGLVAFLLSTVLIVVFGEIIPQASCSRFALQVGSKSVPLVKIIICLLFPLTKPLAAVLDKALGEEVGTIHSRTELKQLMKIHEKNLAVNQHEVGLIQGALTFREVRIQDVMTPIEDVYMLRASTKLDFETIAQIFRSGFSRIPVYGEDVNKPLGLLLTKDLVLVDPNDAVELGEVCNIFARRLLPMHVDQKLGDVFDSFKASNTTSHMVLAYEVVDPYAHGQEGDPYRRSCGVVTLEDILEEIIQEEIVDETDLYVSVDDHIPVDWEGFDIGRLKLLDPRRMQDTRLSDIEIQAIGTHLQNYVNEIEWPEWEHLKILLQSSEIVFKKRTAKTSAYAADEDWLYHVGEPSDKCMIILKGRCATFAAKDTFRSYHGTFSLLGKNALSNNIDEGMYIPDFSACIASEQIRFIVITRSLFEDAHALPPDTDPSTMLSDRSQSGVPGVVAKDSTSGGNTSARESVILTSATPLTRAMVANRRAQHRHNTKPRIPSKGLSAMMSTSTICEEESIHNPEYESTSPDANVEIPPERNAMDHQPVVFL